MMRRTRTPEESSLVKKINLDKYNPQLKTREILDRAWEHVNSVPYTVGLRWVFYRLLQDGYFADKKDYQDLSGYLSSARNRWYMDWRPWTLADETREMFPYVNDGSPPEPDINRLINKSSVEARNDIDLLKYELKHYKYVCGYSIDPNYLQDHFIIIMYEARAMTEQFRTYTKGITLCPFGGQPSIPYKWKLAKFIEEKCHYYDKSGLVLYFGDHDDAGDLIYRTGEADIKKWCFNTSVEFVKCGLTLEQAQYYDVPEQFDHPGNYQWEALTDTQAREIIQTSLENYYNFEAVEESKYAQAQIRRQVDLAVNNLLEENRWLFEDDEDDEDEP
jgi:hypothetical protein